MDTIRRYVIVLVALGLLIGSVIALLASIDQRDYMLRGYANPTQTMALPYRIPRMGVNADLTQYTPTELGEQFALMENMGVVWVRQFVDWRTIEPNLGEYDWSQWDTIVAEMADYEALSLIPVLVGSPEWAVDCSPCRNDILYPPDDSNAFAAFAGAFAERYADQVYYYQIWDEPNIRTAWGDNDPQASHYGGLLTAAAEAIRHNDPDSHIIAAALAPTVETGPQNISDIQYLNALYNMRMVHVADSIAAKAYGFESSPYDRTVDNASLNFSRVIALREVMESYGDATKHLWISNYGWNSLPEDWSGDQSVWGNVATQEQITYTLEAINRADREWPWLGGMILQTWQPDTDIDNPIWGFALMQANGAPTPLYVQLADYHKAQPMAAQNGIFPATSNYAAYSGTWMFSDLGADIGWVQDSQLTFDFAGSDLALVTRQDDYVTNLYVTVDDENANALPLDVNGDAYLLLRSDNAQPSVQMEMLVSDLLLAQHQMQIYADELIPDEVGQRWPIVAFAVSDGDLAAPYNNQIIVAIFAVLVMAAANVVVLRYTDLSHVLAFITRPVGVGFNILLSFATAVALMLSMLLTWGDGVPVLLKRDSIQIGLSMLTAGLLYINEFGIVIVAICVLALFWLIYQRLATGLLLIVFWTPFFLFPVELYTFAFPMVEVLLGITFAAWLLRQIASLGRLHQTTITVYRPRLVQVFAQLKLIDWLVLLWLLSGFLALLWSERLGFAITEYRALFLQPSLFYLMLRTVPLDKRQLHQLVFGLVAAGSVVAVIGIVNWLRGVGIEAEDGLRRLTSVYGSPNNAALYLGRVLPFALALSFRSQNVWRYLIGGITLIIAVALLLTFSAGALFLGIPLAIAVIVILWLGKRAMIPLSGLVVIAVMGLLIAVQFPRFERLTDMTSGTNFYRIRVWQSTANILADHPLTGLGLDQFLYEFRGHYIMPDAWEEPELSHPHNILLDFWTRLGILGVGVLFGGVAAVTFTLRYVWKQAIVERWILIACAGAFVNLLAHGLVDNSIYVIDLSYVTMFLLAVPLLARRTVIESDLMVNSARHNQP